MTVTFMLQRQWDLIQKIRWVLCTVCLGNSSSNILEDQNESDVEVDWNWILAILISTLFKKTLDI